MIISQKKKGIKTKGSKQGVEKTRKRHTLKRRRFWQDDVHKKYVNNKKENKRERKDRRTKKYSKKGTREKQKEWQVFTKEFQKYIEEEEVEKKEGFREEQKKK